MCGSSGVRAECLYHSGRGFDSHPHNKMHKLFSKLVKHFLPKAEYNDYRVVRYFEYSYETNEFLTLEGYVLQLKNEHEFSFVEKTQLTESIYEMLSTKIFLESESSAPIF